MKLTYKDIDYRRQLIRHYKYYKISEKELVILLCLDDFLLDIESSVTSEDLLSYTNLEIDEIDTILANLLEKHLICYEKKDGRLITSLKPLYDKLLNDLKKDIIIQENRNNNLENNSKINNLYSYFENVIGRTLTGYETDRISFWVKSNISKQMIEEAVSKIKARSNNVSIAGIDKILLSMQKNKDIQKEGVSYQNDQEWKKASIDSLNILKKDWINNDN